LRLTKIHLEKIESRLGLKFNNRSLLETALVHRSYLNENGGHAPESNERLEFIGDALVGLVVGQAIYTRLPEATEGSLTTRRSLAVRGDALARAARKYRLGDDLLLGSGERASGGSKRTGNLAGLLEAVIGAVLLDRGYTKASEFVLTVLRDEINNATDTHTPKDPKSLLQEFAQSNGHDPPEYRVIGTRGPDHNRVWQIEALLAGRVVARGQGGRKLDAEREAASKALSELGEPVGTI